MSDKIAQAAQNMGPVAARAYAHLNAQLERALTPRWRIFRRWRLAHEIRALGGDAPIPRSREDAGVKS